MKHRGRGLAAIEYPTGMNQGGDPSQAWVKIKPDGRVDVFAGTVDLGQGSKTVHTQIVADTLGVPYESVNMDVSNTDSSPLCTGTFASRGTFIGGLAVLKAARKAKEKMLEIAGQAMEIDPADLDVEDGMIFVKGSPDKKMSVGEVSAAATWGFGELITGTGVHLKAYSMPDPDTGECDPDHAISYAACVVDVEVDDETGVVTVLNMVQAYDVGHAINPTLVEGQIEGGAMMGLGLGLLEQSYPHYPSTEGRGSEFGAYLMPGMQNLPEITSVIVENPSADGPFGAKAIGEMANNAQGPAICSAIHDAVGVWVPQQPATPERVLRALQAKAAGTDAPRREGKTVIFDEDSSVMEVADSSSVLREVIGI
jgi:CO/xanthine dehydrogenase Mo-binding subunit